MRAELVTPLAHPAFELRRGEDAVELFRPAAVGGRLWLGIELKIFVPGDGSPGRRRAGA